MQQPRPQIWKPDVFPYIDVAMTRETTIRIAIVLALAAGYVVVAVLRSGTAW
jgi:hypothetical protein